MILFWIHYVSLNLAHEIIIVCGMGGPARSHSEVGFIKQGIISLLSHKCRAHNSQDKLTLKFTHYDKVYASHTWLFLYWYWSINLLTLSG